MRHSLEPEYRKYGFLSFARDFGDKYGKSMINSKNVKKINGWCNKNKQRLC